MPLPTVRRIVSDGLYLIPGTKGAVGLYSVYRKMYRTAVYAYRLRRSSDDAEIDIGFVGKLADNALSLAFCGAGDGFITTMYCHKSSGINWSIATASLQPKIINAGALVVSATGYPEIGFDGANDYFAATLPASTTYQFVFGSWCDAQSYQVTSQSSGTTRFPSGATTLGLRCSEFAYFPVGDRSTYVANLKSLYMSDLDSTDIYRGMFSSAGAKTLTLTAGVGHGVTYIDKSGTQTGVSYSRTVDAYDWFVMRATDPTKITTMDWHTKTLFGQIYAGGFAKLTALTTFHCYANQITGSIPSLTTNTALNILYFHANQLTGSIPSLTTNTALSTFSCYTNQITGYDGGNWPVTLGTFEAPNNLLSAAGVNALLAGLVAGGKNSGTRSYKSDGTGNAAPTGQGIPDKAYAQTTLVWTVLTN